MNEVDAGRDRATPASVRHDDEEEQVLLCALASFACPLVPLEGERQRERARARERASERARVRDRASQPVSE
jgi:hypothetical protein